MGCQTRCVFGEVITILFILSRLGYLWPALLSVGDALPGIQLWDPLPSHFVKAYAARSQTLVVILENVGLLIQTGLICVV